MTKLIFRDGSLGQSVSVSVSRIIHLSSDDEMGLSGLDAQRALDKFCAWQLKEGFSEDVSVLMTRTDLCRGRDEDRDCSTLGLGEEVSRTSYL